LAVDGQGLSGIRNGQAILVGFAFKGSQIRSIMLDRQLGNRIRVFCLNHLTT